MPPPAGVARPAPAPLAAARPAWRFLLLAVGSSWTLWWLAAAFAGRFGHWFSTVAVIGGTALVALAAPALLLAQRDRAALRAYVQSLVDLRRLTPAGLFVAIGLFPALACAAAALATILAGTAPAQGAVLGLDGGILVYLKTFGFGLLIGPVLEEMGWRGYALAPLQARYGAPRGAIILTGVHAAWHLPLFFLAGSFQYKLGLLTADFWRFMADVVVFDLLVAGLFNAQRGSVLAAALFHCSFNVAAGLFVLAGAASWVLDGGAAALCLLMFWATRGRLFLRDA